MRQAVLEQLETELEQLSAELHSGLEAIHERGIPAETRWVVLWIGLGARFGLLLLTYMGPDGSAVRGHTRGELERVRAALTALEERLGLGEAARELKVDCEDVFFDWLRRVVRETSFWEAGAGLAMGINNAVVYFDLRSGADVFME